MEIKTRWAQDKNGKVIPFATVSLFYEGTTDLVTGLEDKDGGPLSNPFQSDVNGKTVFAAPDGQYDIKFSEGPRESTASIQFLDVSGALQVVENIDTLRSISGNSGRDYILAKFHTSDGDGGGGNFYWESGAAPGTYVDNGGTVIVPTDGDGSAAWVRNIGGGAIQSSWFGIAADGSVNVIDLVKRLFAAAPDKSTVQFAPGTYLMGAGSDGQNYIRVIGKSFVIMAEGATFVKADGSGYNLFQFLPSVGPSSEAEWQSGDFGLDFLIWSGGAIDGNAAGQDYPIDSETGTWNQDLSNAGLLGVNYAKVADITIEIRNNVSDGVVLVNPLYGRYINCTASGGARPFNRFPQNFKYRPTYGPTRCDVDGINSKDGNIAVAASSPTAPVGSIMYIRAVKSRGATQGSIYIECCETVHVGEFDVDSLVHFSNETQVYTINRGSIDGARFDANNTGGSVYSYINALEVKNNPSLTAPAISALQCKKITDCSVFASAYWGISGHPTGKVTSCTVDGYVGRGISFGEIVNCNVANGDASSTALHRPVKALSTNITAAMQGINAEPNVSTDIVGAKISNTTQSAVFQSVNGTGTVNISGGTFESCGTDATANADACFNLDIANVTVTGATIKNCSKAISHAGNAGSLITALFVGNTLVNVGSIGITDNGTTRIVQNNLTYTAP